MGHRVPYNSRAQYKCQWSLPKYIMLHFCSSVDGAIESRIRSLMGIDNNHYRYLPDLWALESSHPRFPPPPSCGVASPTLKLSFLHSYWNRHPDPSFATYILRGLKDGFHIGFDQSSCSRLISVSRNHPSAAQRHLLIFYATN